VFNSAAMTRHFAFLAVISRVDRVQGDRYSIRRQETTGRTRSPPVLVRRSFVVEDQLHNSPSARKLQHIASDLARHFVEEVEKMRTIAITADYTSQHQPPSCCTVSF